MGRRRKATAPRCAGTEHEFGALDPSVLRWTERLAGFHPDTCREAVAEVRSWGLPHVTSELVDRADVDAAVGSVLLVRAYKNLIAKDIPGTKLLAKLRNEPNTWSVWAELHAADILSHQLAHADDLQGLRLTLEPGKGQGSHPDLRFSLNGGGEAMSIEVKAIGLSDDEVAFFRRAAPLLRKACPRVGLAHLHSIGGIAGEIRMPNRKSRRELDKELARERKYYPTHIRDLAGAIVVGHDSEQAYLERLRDRLIRALERRQLPAEDACWVAVHWSNGAPQRAVAQVLDSIELPPYVLGVVLVGSAVAVPDPDVHHFTHFLGRQTDETTPTEINSLVDPALATEVTQIFESSAGIRPTVVVDRLDKRRNPFVLQRTGERRIFPFNLLLTPDPPEVRTGLRDDELVDPAP